MLQRLFIVEEDNPLYDFMFYESLRIDDDFSSFIGSRFTNGDYVSDGLNYIHLRFSREYAIPDGTCPAGNAPYYTMGRNFLAALPGYSIYDDRDERLAATSIPVFLPEESSEGRMFGVLSCKESQRKLVFSRRSYARRALFTVEGSNSGNVFSLESW